MTAQTDNTQPQAKQNKRSKLFPIILSFMVLGGAFFGVKQYLHGLKHEETDDAQVDAGISPIIPHISGYISRVMVTDNQRVRAGDTLLLLDNREMLIKLHQAKAAMTASLNNVDVARASANAAGVNVATAQANIATVDAQIEAAKINVWRATQDFTRYANLIKDHSITQQQYEQALAAKQTAEKQLNILREQRNTALQQKRAIASQSNMSNEQITVAHAGTDQRRADIEAAELNLSYTVITAPVDGYIAKVTLQPGQLVNAGQQLFSIVVDNALWITANFKETQIEKMKEKQKVIVHIDAFPGHDFHAQVSSFSPATGARFSLLPPDNATGNFVKVVQRLPVKIDFIDKNDQLLAKLKPGMNAQVDVHLN